MISLLKAIRNYMPIIDFNADVGEGMGNESVLMPYLSSCNIACGGHAGSISEMKTVIVLAKHHKVKIGAHPSYPDKDNFGRKELELSRNELFDSIYNQVLLLNQLVIKEGLTLNHIKPHGALYHKVAKDIDTAQLLIEVIQLINSKVALVGLPNSVLHTEAEKANISFIKEGFADRIYNNDGSLVSRKLPNAVIHTTDLVKEQVLSIAINKKVKTINNQWIDLDVETICFHSDNTNSIELLKACYNSINMNEND